MKRGRKSSEKKGDEIEYAKTKLEYAKSSSDHGPQARAGSALFDDVVGQ